MLSFYLSLGFTLGFKKTMTKKLVYFPNLIKILVYLLYFVSPQNQDWLRTVSRLHKKQFLTR
jgi:hypothetical protein